MRIRSLQLLWLVAPATVLVVSLGCATRAPMIVERSAWDTFPPSSYVGRPQHVRRIVIHHDAVDYPPEQTGEMKLRLLLRASRERAGWPDVPYHYLIDRDGRIFSGRPEQYVGETRTPYDPSDALQIALLGNYSQLEPTPAQTSALVALVRAKARQFGVAADDIKLHADLADTECPGTNVRRRLARFNWLVH